ncbi:fimbrial protein [Stenotrophomonas chelatiphaga]|uniref:fimbrial protein n=1 Tax=Stenotrophomonas chelatiphaga TaxID=517011 RepID=UPI0028A2794B|nr:fimbrial protein [Stenotrophomonas chelatiphaga]
MPARTGGTGLGNSNDLFAGLGYKLIARGGPMSGGAMPAMQGSTRILAYPGAGNVQHSHTADVLVPALPCALSDTTLVLPTITAADIVQPGATAATRPLEVTMRCPSAGSNVRLTLEDANGNSARIGELVPAAGSNVKGVRLRMLRNGQPVAFGVPWDHGTRQDGTNTIRLEAQYIRTDGVLQPGALRGEARLTADYP